MLRTTSSIKNSVVFNTLIATFAISASTGSNAWALNADGTGTRYSNLQVLYNFNETTGPYLDTSGVGTPSNLDVFDSEAALTRGAGFVKFNTATRISQSTADTKLLNACKATNEVSIEAWVLPTQSGSNFGPIINLTSSSSNTGANFTLFQNPSNFWQTIVRTRSLSNVSQGVSVTSPTNYLKVNNLQHIIASRDATGLVRIWVEGIGVVEGNMPPIDQDGDFSTWSNTARIFVGNEFTGETNPWLGEMHLVAVYCSDVLREVLAPAKMARPTYTAPTTTPIADNIQKARRLHLRIAGVTFPADHPTILSMAADIQAGNLMAAAAKATNDPDFVNITIRSMASKMQNKDENPKLTALDDFIATFMGVAHNNLDSRLLLSGNFLYEGDPTKVSGLPVGIDNVQKSNKHYDYLVQVPQIALGPNLISKTQQVVNSANSLVNNPEPAGVLTSRSFGKAYFVAGTNRAPVKFSLQQFNCGDLNLAGTSLPMVNVRDGSLPDYRIGKDIDRGPGGLVGTFKNECRTCHSAMDGLRPAFAKWHYFAADATNTTGFIKHSSLFSAVSATTTETATNIQKDASDIMLKMNQNSSITPLGFTVVNTNFKNFYTNSLFFGFRGTKDTSGYITGTGTAAYGTMLSNATSFGRCMAGKAFQEVCGRDIVSGEIDTMNQIGADFEANGFSLKYLFQRVATIPNCVGL